MCLGAAFSALTAINSPIAPQRFPEKGQKKGAKTGALESGAFLPRAAFVYLYYAYYIHAAARLQSRLLQLQFA